MTTFLLFLFIDTSLFLLYFLLTNICFYFIQINYIFFFDLEKSGTGGRVSSPGEHLIMKDQAEGSQ